MPERPEITLYYEDVDITEDVDILECIHRDVSCGARDCLNLKVDHAEKWLMWGPQKNDTLRIVRAGYDTKVLYLNTVVPEDGAYRILATGAKAVPFTARWQSFEDMTYASIMAMCASECGMGAKQYGVTNATFEYLLRENASAPVFMETLANREGAVLKSLGGDFVSIGIDYAQALTPVNEVELERDQVSSKYIDRRDQSWSRVEINTPFGRGIAMDSGVSGQKEVVTDLSVDNDAQAKRWARGLLLMHNRQSEILELSMDFNPDYTAMMRVDVNSSTDANGQWLIHEVEHDLLNGRTKPRLVRCISTVF